MSTLRYSRRRLLGTTAAGATAAALSTNRLHEALAARRAPAVIQSDSKLVYWGGLIFSEAASELLTAHITAWGEANGVETEVVMINQNETNQKVSAAVESGTMPDALDMGLDLLLLLSTQGQLAAIDDLVTKIGDAQGGWFDAMASASDTTAIAGARCGLPYGAGGNLLFRRNDILTEKGLSTAPETWQELQEQAAAAGGDGVYGLGLALSNVGDGNLNVSIMQSYGGRVADDAGTACTIKSDATRAFLEWVKAGWDQGLYPTDAATWDGAGDNNAYLSGQAVFNANTGSVAIAAGNDDPELLAATAFSPMPAGPTGRISPITPVIRAIPTSTPDVDRAKALLEHLADPTFMASYFDNAIFAPVLKNQAAFAAFDGNKPVLAGLKALVEEGTPPGYPDVYNTAYADFLANFIVPKMCQRVVIDGWDLDRAMDEAQEQGTAIYAKYA